MNTYESDIESFAREQIKLAGGWMLKWVSPGQNGVLDDIIFWPHGVVHFAEFKQDTGRQTEIQKWVTGELLQLGAICFVFKSKVEVLRYIAENTDA